MEAFHTPKQCKYCRDFLELCLDEGLQCRGCQKYVHVRCLKRGTVPGGINGDLFYTFTCSECSSTDSEVFVRNKLSWLHAITLALYHLQTRSSGLARNGFFHWRNHIVSFIDRYWEVLFPGDTKRKKKWVGTVAGRLSHYSSYVFLSGSKTVYNKPAWWTLVYPKLTPFVISELYGWMQLEKQTRAKIKGEKRVQSDPDLFQNLVDKAISDHELKQQFNIDKAAFDQTESEPEEPRKIPSKTKLKKRKAGLLPNYSEASDSKLIKLASSTSFLPEEPHSGTDSSEPSDFMNMVPVELNEKNQPLRLLDPMCHYNTSLNNISRMMMQKLQAKLTGGVRTEMILSPYSKIYLKPYIRRDMEAFPHWLKLMAEIQLVANREDPEYELPSRAPLDYTYVQPEHIPAINSLCNQFFWPGIDLTESLQYPDFSCVVLYKRLIVGFAFLVPDVHHTENYISFVFTRPGWRNCGIGRFMVYHLIQTSLGKDITLHVSINNPALFLYQKFGFKVENVALDFYDKYFRNDVNESKHAFFCRLER